MFTIYSKDSLARRREELVSKYIIVVIQSTIKVAKCTLVLPKFDVKVEELFLTTRQLSFLTLLAEKTDRETRLPDTYRWYI